MKTITIIHGPNLNLLGTRQPEVYGTLTLEEINRRLTSAAHDRGINLEIVQTNLEGEIINALHAAQESSIGVVLNPGGYTHTSVAIRDAIASLSIPVVEAHLSNIHAREEFRHISITAGAARGLVAGFGWRSYLYALDEVFALTA